MDLKNIGIGSDLCLDQPDMLLNGWEMALGLKVKIMEKDLKTNLVFLNNQNGSKMLEGLQISKLA